MTLHATLRRFVDAGFTACAIEASSIGVVEHRLEALPIGVALFTNFTQDHLDVHGSMDAYWAAKRRLFAWPGLRAAVLNVDDPAIAVPFRTVTAESAAQGEAALWQLYDAIRAETLLLRGAESDLLSHETAQAMTTRGPRARLVEFPGVGHAPTLVASDQIDCVAVFLLGASQAEGG